jgi:formylglycine-generating enzyme required for sulfatase activity
MDMAGNVWEWQENWYHETEKSRRALRGGSWNDSSDVLRCTTRDGSNPDDRYSYVGFRVALAQSFFDTPKL